MDNVKEEILSIDGIRQIDITDLYARRGLWYILADRTIPTESLETIDDICDTLRQIPTSFDCNRYRRQKSIDNYDPTAIDSVVEKYRNAPIPEDNKWDAPLFPSSNNTDPEQNTATYTVPDEKYRKLTQSLDQIRGLYNDLQNHQKKDSGKCI